MKHDATNRFMRDAICGCDGSERFLLLHHAMYDCRPRVQREYHSADVSAPVVVAGEEEDSFFELAYLPTKGVAP
jgi:hypothetical protein